MKCFDYIYYRLAKFYMKWDGKFASTALLGVSSIQAMIIGNIILALSYILDFKTPDCAELHSVPTNKFSKTQLHLTKPFFPHLLLLVYL